MAMSHLLLILALLSALVLTSSAANGSMLTQSGTISGNQTLDSPSNAFQLGLFAASNRSRWFLGIWFAVSPDTVVWVANRDRPLTSPSGVVELSGGGALVLRDAATNDTVWSSSNSSSSSSAAAVAVVGAVVAELRDTGNLVLTDAAGAVLWQSFEHPTNTFLPEMRVGKSIRTGADWSLSSWRGADDPSPGDFRYVMDTSGSPELYIWSHGRKTYRTGPWNGVRFSGIPEMTTFSDMFDFQFTATADEVSYMFRNRDGSPMSRVLLNESGVMQRMVWDQASGAWSNFWSGPRDQCDGYAKCGAFGVCSVVDAVVCGCITGFAPRSVAEWYMRNTSGGCARRTPLQCGDGDGFYVLRGVKLPDTHSSAVDPGASLQECARRCLATCSCTAYSAADIRGGGSGCIQWFGDLVDTRFVDDGQDLYVRLAKSELDVPKNTRKFVAVIALVVTGFTLLLLSLAFVIWRKARRSKKVNTLDDAAELMSGECPTYPLGVIRTATKGFCADSEIGRGGFGIVYKGQLPDGQQVAVKKLSAENTAQGLNEFMNEVVLIAKLQHRNLVRLLGCCVHCSERMLVYEYMSNKSLDAFIFDEKRRASLSWKTRLDVILGIARGVLYLHRDSRLNIIHRDLKAANVLLDADMVAKISDFGIARLFSSSADRQETITRTIIGTYGYMAPEYAMDGTVSFMQDVYSFGVLLLEIVSGRKNQRSFNLIAHAWGLWEGGRSHDLMDPAIRGGCTAGELEQAATCVQVALLCVQECPSQRPPMADVIPMLSQQKAPARPRRPVVCTPMMSSSHPAAAAAAALAAQAEITGGNGDLTITSLEGR
ncbi:Receptor-like serine/threonine-protein kinase SD1-8 [Dichanthelium oligosanthes]|uniref:Receptor-like serine/threonine-protein kinase n=1 Tax=Dichanthelium oligosanthes TaxID=888268 RepID=A0A1E5W4R6_9POAL|nr:Receptor-like serine/threonine-protein kinase SD1-8 [Dichanthelium oligosanthes]